MQSLRVRQPPQCVLRQICRSPEQSVLWTHSTQFPVTRSQIGAAELVQDADEQGPVFPSGTPLSRAEPSIETGGGSPHAARSEMQSDTKRSDPRGARYVSPTESG